MSRCGDICVIPSLAIPMSGPPLSRPAFRSCQVTVAGKIKDDGVFVFVEIDILDIDEEFVKKLMAKRK